MNFHTCSFALGSNCLIDGLQPCKCTECMPHWEQNNFEFATLLRGKRNFYHPKNLFCCNDCSFAIFYFWLWTSPVQSSPHPGINFSCYKYVRRLICLLKVVIMLKSMAFLELINQKFKSWARKRPAISECKLRLKKVVIDEIKNTR